MAKIPTGTALLVKLMEWERKTGSKFMALLIDPANVSLTDVVTMAEIVAGEKPETPKEAMEIYMQIMAEVAGTEQEAKEALSPEEQQALTLLDNAGK